MYDSFSLGPLENFEDIVDILAEAEPLAVYYDFIGVFEVGIVGQEVVGGHFAVVDQQVEGEVEVVGVEVFGYFGQQGEVFD